MKNVIHNNAVIFHGMGQMSSYNVQEELVEDIKSTGDSIVLNVHLYFLEVLFFFYHSL